MALLPSVASPMHGAVVPIKSTTVAGTTTNNIIFSNIPQTYQDLMIVSYLNASASNVYPGLTINSDSGTNYSETHLAGNGASPSSYRSTNGTAINFTSTSLPSTTNLFMTAQMHILNYANTSTYKTLLLKEANDNNGSGFVALSVDLWRGTSRIATLSITSFSAFFTAGSSIALYGIRTVGQ
jgi:hypothetical protein